MDLTAFDSVIKFSFINWDNIDRINKKENSQFIVCLAGLLMFKWAISFGRIFSRNPTILMIAYPPGWFLHLKWMFSGVKNYAAIMCQCCLEGFIFHYIETQAESNNCNHFKSPSQLVRIAFPFQTAWCF